MKFIRVFTGIADNVDRLDDAEAGRVFKAVLAYANGQDPQEESLTRIELMVFDEMRRLVATDLAKYEEMCRTNQRIAASRSTTPRHDSSRPVTERDATCQVISNKLQVISDKSEERTTDSAEVNSAPVATLPLVDGTVYGIPQEDAERDSKAYPAVDVMQEYLKMEAWLRANPRNMKTRRGIKSFINSWLDRAQNHARPEAGKPKVHYNAAAELLREVSG